jgi:iron complex transport system permease protein
LGTSAGGAAAAAIVFYLGWHSHSIVTLPLAAVCGAIGATSLILWLCARPGGLTLEHILLAGFTLNTLLGAITSLVISFTLEDFQRAPAIISWLMGSLSARGWEHVSFTAVPLVIAWLLATRLTRALDILSFGEEIATSLSLDFRRFRWQVIGVIALLVGVVVSVAGALPFVGLIVPHLTRLIAGPHHGRLLILSTMNGMTLVILADLMARTIRAPQDMEVGILITMVGAPFFGYLLYRHAQGATS